MYFFTWIISVFFDAMMVMFAVALLGHPLGYLVCLMLTYTATTIMGTGTYNGLNAMRIMEK